MCRCVITLWLWLGQLALLLSLGPPSETTLDETGPRCKTISQYCNYDAYSMLGVVVSRDEAAGIIASQHRRKESGTLAAYEDQLNEVARRACFQ